MSFMNNEQKEQNRPFAHFRGNHCLLNYTAVAILYIPNNC